MATIKTTSDLRQFLANLAVGVAQGDADVQKAAVAIKACKEINASLYSEIKSAAMQVELGRKPHGLGDMPITTDAN